MTIKTYIDRYLEEGRKPTSEKETLFISRGIIELYQVTGEPKYKKAKEAWCVSEEMLRMPDDIENEPVFCASDLYTRISVYMKYETNAGKKEKYNAILHLVKEMYKALYQKEVGLCRMRYEKGNETQGRIYYSTEASAYFAMGLVDLLSVMAQEVFEQYKAYEDMLKEIFKGLFAYYKEGSPIFLTHPNEEICEKNKLDLAASLMVSCAILKACRLHVLLAEKYQPIGEAILAACAKEIESFETRQDIVGELSLAYAQYLALRKSQGEAIEI